MKKINISAIALIAFLGLSKTVNAQLFDGFTQKKGDLSITTSYTYSNFDEFYVGKEKTSNDDAGLGDLTQSIYSLYAKYGITKNVSAIVNLPYISADDSDLSKFQDLSLAVKVNVNKFDFKKADLNIVTGLGFSLPLGYNSNDISSIGSGAFTVSFTGGLHLNTNVGFFSTILASYNLRDTAENEITGGDFNVPNNFSTTGKIGYASSIIYADAWVRYVASGEGVDIGTPEFTGFPETDVDYNTFGITLYKNIIPQLGISISYSKIFDGRNVGASSNYSAGVTYNLTK